MTETSRMQKRIRSYSYVLVPFIWQLTTVAAEPISVVVADTQVEDVHSDSLGFAAMRATPNLGNGGPTGGLLNYDRPFRNYGTWYRPKAFSLTPRERCQPGPFRPRGYGNLFNRQSDPRRMDYAAYQIKDSRSVFGPSYYAIPEDQHCKSCQKSACLGCGLPNPLSGLGACTSCDSTGCTSCGE